MDPYRFGYSPIVERPKLSWPNNARVAVWVCPNIEHYEYLPAEVRVRNPWPRVPHPDVLGYGGRDYGNRVGLWRMFEVLDKHSIRCTVSLSMSVIEMYPEILEAMEARRWEYMSHGYFNTRYHWGYSEQEEREVIEHSNATHLRLTGRKLRGWFSPAVSNTLNGVSRGRRERPSHVPRAASLHDGRAAPAEASRPRAVLHPPAQGCLGLHRRGDPRLVRRQRAETVPAASREGGVT